VNLTAVTLFSFVGLASAVTAGGLLVRDLFFAKSGQDGSDEETADAEPLGRLSLARDAEQPGGLVQRLDGRYSRLVAESGVSMDALSVTLIQVLSGLLLGGVLLLWSEDLLQGTVAFLIGLFLPLPYLVLRRSRRQQRIQAQLADVVDLMARATRAGESLEQSIEMVGTRAAEPLATEFRRCAKHLQMGLALPAAMRALVHRVPMMEVRILATTLSVHRQTGGNLAVTLERMARVIRDRLAYRRQLRTVTAAGRFSATLIAMAGPLLFLFMFAFQREYASKLLTLPLGNMLLGGAVVLEIIGVFWLSRLLRREY
jgi:tight adherence protein B